jgi:hypothetical protein
MKYLRLKQQSVSILFSVLAGAASADTNSLNLTLPVINFDSQQSKSFLLANNDSEVISIKSNITGAPKSAEFEPKLFSGRKLHQYLGVGTVALAGMTFMTHIHPVGNAPRDVNGTHAELGKATALMALATVASGLIVHWDDFNFEDGWKDPDNQHVVLGVTGAALMAFAVNKSMNVSNGQVNHAGFAELGALSMVVAVKLTW